MKKFKLIVASILASTMILAGCGKSSDPTPSPEPTPTPEPSGPAVKSIAIESEGGARSVGLGSELKLSAKLEVVSGTATGVTWSIDNDNASLSATSGKDVVLTGLVKGEVKVTVTSTFDSTKSASVDITIGEKCEWSKSEKALMMECYGELIPFFRGDFTWTDEYLDDYGCFCAESLNLDDYQKVIDDYDALGFDCAELAGYVEYIIPSANEKYYYAADVYIDDSVVWVDVYKYLVPTDYWPADEIAAVLDPYTEVEVPAADGDLFVLCEDSSYYYCYVLVSGGDYEAYLTLLNNTGFNVFYDYYFYCWTAEKEDLAIDIYTDDDMIQISFYKYDSGVWPASHIASICNGYTEVEVPEAEGNKYECQSMDPNLYFYFGQINVYGGDLEAYKEVLNAAEFNVYYDTDYGCWSAIKDDLGIDLYSYEGVLCIALYKYVAPTIEWPTEDIAALVTTLGATGTVVEYEGEYSNVELISPSEESDSGYILVSVKDGTEDDAIDAYYQQLEDAGYFILDVGEYGDRYYAKDGETLCLTAYQSDYGIFAIELVCLSEPAVEPEPAVFPTDEITAFINGRTEETVPEMSAYRFVTSDQGTYFEIRAYFAKPASYAQILSDAGWDIEYNSSAYQNVATSPEGTLKIILQDYSSSGYFVIDLYYVAPKLTEWPAADIEEALGTKAKTALPGPSGEGIEYEFEKLSGDACSIKVYNSAPADYVEDLVDAGFEITQGSAEDYYWYLLSADKTVKVIVTDDLADGKDYFEVRANGQNPTWTSDHFDSSAIENMLGLTPGMIPEIESGTSFTYTDNGDHSCSVVVKGGDFAAYSAALLDAGFTQDLENQYYFTKDNITLTFTFNVLAGKMTLNFSVSAS